MKHLLLIITALLTACATGPIYQDAPPPVDEAALIYFMRGDITYGGGYKTSFSVNDREVTRLYDDGYSWIHLNPGVYYIQAKGKELKLNIESGKTYYIKYSQPVKFENGKAYWKNIVKSYSKDDIYEELKTFRLTEATPYHLAPLNMRRKASNTDKTSKAQLSIGEVKSKVLPKSLSVNIYDDSKTCNGSLQYMIGSGKPSDMIQIEAGKYQTFSAISKGRVYGMSAYCYSKMTFFVEEGGDYELNLKTKKDAAMKPHDCEFSIKDRLSGKNIPLIFRKLNNLGFGDKCSSSELEKPKFENNITIKMRCSYSGKSGDC